MSAKTNHVLYSWGGKKIPQGTQLNLRALEDNWFEVIDGEFIGLQIDKGFLDFI